MKTSNRRVTTMVERAEAYLAHRRSLGFKLNAAGYVLLDFATFADQVQPGRRLTNDLALRWATRSERYSSRYRAARLSIVRGFARFVAVQDGEGEVPDKHALSGEFRRAQPHIYTDEQVGELLHAAASLLPTYPLRPHVYEVLFGLLASTGLRISEALALRRKDADLGRGVLRINETKYRKSRLVPVHDTVAQHLRHFCERRDRESDARVSEWFLFGRGGSPLPYTTVRTTFQKIREQHGWQSNGSLPRPRIHDLRHTFACRRLLQWYRDGIDVDHAITSLSTYLGHGKVTDTYWYLGASGALLGIASDRFARFALEGRPEP